MENLAHQINSHSEFEVLKETKKLIKFKHLARGTHFIVNQFGMVIAEGRKLDIVKLDDENPEFTWELIQEVIELYDQEKVENLRREEIQEMMNLRFKNETEFVEKFSEFLLQ
jgi:hypothetical protein